MSLQPYTPSPEQQQIFSTIQSMYQSRQTRSLLISAKAGAGKSSTIVQLLEYIPSNLSVLYLTFGKQANIDLNTKITGFLDRMRDAGRTLPKSVECKTVHQIGRACLSRKGIKTDDPGKYAGKYRKIALEFLANNQEVVDYDLASELKDLVEKVQVTLADPNDQGTLLSLVHEYHLDIDFTDKAVWDLVVRGVPAILKRGIDLASAGEFNFTDMIWLPSSRALNLRPWNHAIVFIDEAQDISNCERELAFKCKWERGITIAVGDRAQAIFKFKGANSHSLDLIKEESNALELSLSACYRCPRRVVDLAATVRPGIVAAPEATEGDIRHITQEMIDAEVQAGDAILCRYTAPLVKTCLKLLRQGKRANVRGKDLGSTFHSLLEKIKKHLNVQQEQVLFENLVDAARMYASQQIDILMRNKDENEGEMDALRDRVETLIALYEHYLQQQTGAQTGSLEGFLSMVNDFFREDKGAQIILSTGHGAKGLEWERVFLLGYSQLPIQRGDYEKLQQEGNLLYVMLTRAKSVLYLVVDHLPSRPEEPLMSESEASSPDPDPDPEPDEPNEPNATNDANEPNATNDANEEATDPTPPTTQDEHVSPSESRRGRPAGSRNKRHKTAEEAARDLDITLPPDLWEALLRVAGKRGRADYIASLLKQDEAILHALDHIASEKQEAQQAQQPETNQEQTNEEPSDSPSSPTKEGPTKEGEASEEPETPANTSVSVPVPVAQVTQQEVLPLVPLVPLVSLASTVPPAPTPHRYVFTCKRTRCKHVWTEMCYQEGYRLTHLDESGERVSLETQRCPLCGNHSAFLDRKPIKGTVSNHTCDARCWNAKSHLCECACGGANHGSGLAPATHRSRLLDTADMLNLSS